MRCELCVHTVLVMLRVSTPVTITVAALAMVCALVFAPGNVVKAVCITALAAVTVAAVVMPCPRDEWVNDAAMYLAVFVCSAILFPLTDVCIRAGLWKFSRPDVWGIPCWLPPAWGFTALFVASMHQWGRARLSARGVRKCDTAFISSQNLLCG